MHMHPMHSYISVTDEVKINDQKNQITTEPYYLHTEFEVIWTLLPEDVAPWGIRHCNISIERSTRKWALWIYVWNSVQQNHPYDTSSKFAGQAIEKYRSH